ncbi:efflux RND transporter permease subunit [Caulobacter segnis]|uniref:Multidrug transporter AcrB n=1 Tax=Caulobacter segnis TaxID=88688 RepID=A0A2W5XG00_9CAUL|nr:efflux RND transporter permease subunit [Caulobacter segnis]PZR36701.1 MAG: multidrug transporter AcrB [Caulobacter segnis]
MKGPNLSSWALAHEAMMRFLIAVAVIGGLYAYAVLGRQEDPDYTVKNMLVSATWPGANGQSVADQVAEPIERGIQTLPEVDYMRTNIQAGRMIINVRLRDDLPPSQVNGVWTRIRQRVSERAAQLPEGVQGPQYNDDFGDTYGNIYALTGDGFTLPQLKAFADRLRDDLRRLPDAGRIELEGEPQERIYIEYQSAKLASLGVDPRSIIQTLHETNTISSAGEVDAVGERIQIDVTGAFDSVESIRQLGITANGRSVRLGDIATVRRALVDPPTFKMRVNGADAVGVMVSLRKGGDVTRLGHQAHEVIAAFRARLPAGVSLHVIADQPEVVKESIGEFTRSLAEAVVIVLVVSFLSLGVRPGVVVALSIPIVLAATFATMLMLGIPLHRISLGALIIALGLLVDDAIIVIEQIDSHLASGWAKIKAVTAAYTVTAQPMLIGTLITMLGFLPIALANSAAGEYSRSIFYVVAISLLFSWIVAVFVTPYLANKMLRETPAKASAEGEARGHHSAHDGAFYRRFRGLVRWSLDRRWAVIASAAGAFILSIGVFAVAVPKQFFPASDRPELIVDLRASQNASFEQTSAVARRLEKALAGDRDITSIATYVGGGTPRFYLSLDVQTPNLSLAQVVIQTTGGKGRQRVHDRIEALLASQFPEVRGRISTLEMGPAIGQPFKIRLTGSDYAQLAPAAERIEALMRANGRLSDVNTDYGDALKTVKVDVDQDKARALGVTSLNIEQALQAALEGAPITRYRTGDKSLPVVARLDAAERNRLDRLAQVNVATASGRMVPLSQVARLTPAFQMAELNRRSGMPTITLQADTVKAQPADVAAGMKKDLDAISASLPAGATLMLGGSIEEGANSQASVMSKAPIALVLILLLLVMQLQSLKKVALVVLTGPLALIGMALILSIFQIPFGFVAMLGGLSLFGMVIRNSLFLVTQIDQLESEGVARFDAIVEATVQRLRPIMLTALAAILAMIPLTRSVFWGPMAWAIMGGLMAATLLTLIFLPAVYAAAYGVREAASSPEASHA